jgi:hypothetical protein
MEMFFSSGGHINLHVIKLNRIKHEHMHTHTQTHTHTHIHTHTLQYLQNMKAG